MIRIVYYSPAGNQSGLLCLCLLILLHICEFSLQFIFQGGKYQATTLSGEGVDS